MSVVTAVNAINLYFLPTEWSDVIANDGEGWFMFYNQHFGETLLKSLL